MQGIGFREFGFEQGANDGIAAGSGFERVDVGTCQGNRLATRDLVAATLANPGLDFPGLYTCDLHGLAQGIGETSTAGNKLHRIGAGLGIANRWHLGRIGHGRECTRKRPTVQNRVTGNLEKEAIRSFASLNFLLLVLLGFEVNSCFKPDANLAENLHGNVYAVIFSILTAILVVMYYFSGSTFQLSRIRIIKQLAFTWISQNALLAGIGLYKTVLYISALGLTYKRVATMEFLVSIVLCLGLVVLALMRKKGNEWLMERCLLVCFGLFIGFSMIRWDRQVVVYNYRHFPDRNPEYYDRLSLSGYAEYLEINPKAPYWSKNVHRKRAEFEINFHNAHWLGKTLEDNRIAKTLSQHPRPAKPF